MSYKQDESAWKNELFNIRDFAEIDGYMTDTQNKPGVGFVGKENVMPSPGS